MMKPVRLLATLCLGTASLFAQHASGVPAFSYEGADGPSHWGDLSPDYSVCKTGREQSPVDIRNATKAPLPPIRFDYKSVPLRLINNGHTVQVNYAAGSSISVGGERYELKQFHFHRPGEERIDGRAFDMVIHLVHTNQRGEVAVVAVLLEKGAANAALQKIWAEMPKTPGQEHQVHGVLVSASDFLPSDPSYYTYKGSLTTPPCTESVAWFILKTPITVSAGQIQAFSAIFPPNARPMQSLGARIITQSWPTQ
jgi:carbonic anhydrase